MGLWARLKRVFFASTGAALDKIENPELVLQQTIRDMRDRVPELNNSVAQVMATERLFSMAPLIGPASQAPCKRMRKSLTPATKVGA